MFGWVIVELLHKRFKTQPHRDGRVGSRESVEKRATQGRCSLPQLTPALTLPQVRYGLSVLLLEVFCTPGIDYICRQVSRQLMRNELARFYHHRTRKCLPPKKLCGTIQ